MSSEYSVSHEPQLRYAARRFASPRFSALLAMAVPIAVLSVLFPDTVGSMVATWWRSGTFAHGFAVVPIALFLSWRQGERLAHEPVRPSMSGGILLAALAFVWLLGQAASVVSAAQFAVAAMVPALVLTLFGREWLRQLAFPCAFLLFCVPFGEVLVPAMIQWTADFLVASLRLSGVPVHREGNFLTIPSGTWSVVDACSGVRYLIASLMTGVLFAHLMYRSRVRRAAFVAMSIALPIVANWLRAYGIVMLGHLSDNRIATGVDHLVYGWLFFGLVVFLLLYVGVCWREGSFVDAEPRNTSASASPRRIAARGSLAAAGAVAVAVLLPWRLAADAIAPEHDAGPRTIAPLPVTGDWTAVPTPEQENWAPRLQGERALLRQVFVRDDGRRVSLVLVLFRAQRQGEELISSRNVVAPAEDTKWKAVAEGTRTGVGRYGNANFVELAGPGGHRLVWHWYWLGATVTTSAVRAKLELAVRRLRGRSDASAWVLVYTDAEDNADAQETLAAFMTAMSNAIDAALTEVAR